MFIFEESLIYEIGDNVKVLVGIYQNRCGIITGIVPSIYKRYEIQFLNKYYGSTTFLDFEFEPATKTEFMLEKCEN